MGFWDWLFGRHQRHHTVDETPVSAPDNVDVIQSGNLSRKVHVMEGDTLQLKYQGEVVAEAPVTKEDVGSYDRYAVFRTGEDAFGAEHGLGGVFLRSGE